MAETSDLTCQICRKAKMNKGDIYYGYEITKHYWCPNCGTLALFAYASDLKGLDYKFLYNEKGDENGRN